MNKLTEKHVIMLNEKMANQNGDTPAIKDGDVLKQVIEAPYEKDAELFYIHKNRMDKAAVLGIGIAQAKPFANNNLATATLALFTYLELNGKKLDIQQEDVYELHNLLENGEVPQVIEWIEAHS